MDPVSQAVFGASLSQSFAADKSKQLGVMVIGALSGMAADLDVLIRSATDPMLFLEYHRQFTHSLIFIPVGALICAVFFNLFLKFKLTFKQIYLFSFLGYATHALLDACTSYGTQLFWPFSNDRIAWNTVSIVDPFFTIPIIVLIVLAVRKNNVNIARAGFIFAVCFLSLGWVQNQRAESAVFQLAKQRGHEIEKFQVKPSFANRYLWKLIYEYDDKFYVDAVKLLWDVKIYPGDSVEKLNIQKDFAWLPENSQQAKDIQRFDWFSNGFLARSIDDENFIIDMRYSYVPNSIDPMWGIVLDENKILNDKDGHVVYKMLNDFNEEKRQQFFEMLF